MASLPLSPLLRPSLSLCFSLAQSPCVNLAVARSLCLSVPFVPFSAMRKFGHSVASASGASKIEGDGCSCGGCGCSSCCSTRRSECSQHGVVVANVVGGTRRRGCSQPGVVVARAVVAQAVVGHVAVVVVRHVVVNAVNVVEDAVVVQAQGIEPRPAAAPECVATRPARVPAVCRTFVVVASCGRGPGTSLIRQRTRDQTSTDPRARWHEDAASRP